MSSYSKLNYHIIFATKYRRPLIVESLEPRLYPYICGIVKKLKGCVLEINGIADHVHLLLNLPPTKAISDALRVIKANSSKWVNELDEFDEFEWQRGYAAFSVSYSNVDSVRRYIINQKEHHKVRTLTEEFIDFLVKHDISYRPEYLFEDEHHG